MNWFQCPLKAHMMSLAIDCCCQARSAPPATQKANVITSSKVDEVEDISEIEEKECDKATEECGEEDDEVEDEENWQKVVERERKEQLMKLCAEPRVLDAAFKAALSAAAECLAPKQQPAVKAKPKMKSVETAEKKVKDDTKRKKRRKSRLKRRWIERRWIESKRSKRLSRSRAKMWWSWRRIHPPHHHQETLWCFLDCTSFNSKKGYNVIIMRQLWLLQMKIDNFQGLTISLTTWQLTIDTWHIFVRMELLMDYNTVPHVQAGFFELGSQPNGLNRQIKLLKLGCIEANVFVTCVRIVMRAWLCNQGHIWPTVGAKRWNQMRGWWIAFATGLQVWQLVNLLPLLWLVQSHVKLKKKFIDVGHLLAQNMTNDIRGNEMEDAAKMTRGGQSSSISAWPKQNR